MEPVREFSHGREGPPLTAPPPRPFWVLISGFWGLITLAAALQDWLFRRGDLAMGFRFAATQWLPWTILTPGIVWFTSRFTLERDNWRRRLGLHLLACITISALVGLLSYSVAPPPFLRHGHAPRLPDMAELPGGPPSGDKFIPPPPFEALGRPPHWLWLADLLRRSTFQFPLYWAIVGMAHAFLFHERARERERHAVILESRLTKARLQALQMQLNPHFLFNTLNSIASLVHESPRVADEMISSLSEFLRLTLQTSDRSEVTLREELQYLDHYLAIEQIRFGERLRVEKEIDPATLELLVPVLLLQPLVENSIKHGIETRIEPGTVRICATCSAGNLRLQVADNGRGLRVAAGDLLKEGVGLANIRARLDELAGAAAALRLSPTPEGGLLAEIQLPCRRPAAPAAA